MPWRSAAPRHRANRHHGIGYGGIGIERNRHQVIKRRGIGSTSSGDWASGLPPLQTISMRGSIFRRDGLVCKKPECLLLIDRYGCIIEQRVNGVKDGGVFPAQAQVSRLCQTASQTLVMVSC